VSGDYVGQGQLRFNAGVKSGYPPTGQYGSHLIFTGVEHLYEGTTIAHISGVDNGGVLQLLAAATDGKACIAVHDPIPSDFNQDSNCKVDSGVGRICIDCGFTKLVCEWDSAGTARYIVNATCWMAAAERYGSKAEKKV
jgi:hypothetical protein